MTIEAARRELCRLRNVNLSDLPPLQIPAVPQFYDPAVAIDCATKCIPSVSTIEKYNITEQLILAYIDTSNFALAKKHIDDLSIQFPSSSRVARLKGMLYESTDPAKSAKIYAQTITNDPTNVACLKRLALISSRPEGIKLLCMHVDTYMQDIEAWTALCRLYIEELMFMQASFCMEEIMLLRPGNHLYMLRYADLQASMGKLSVGLKYYCAVIEVCSGSLYAWYGVYSLTKLMIQDKIGDKENNKELHKVATKQIALIYGTQTNATVKSWLNKPQ
jgi:ER membrane protein complex subunit 2